MAVKNFVLRENWVGSMVVGMTFFAIFDPTWTHTLALKELNMKSLKQYFSQERQKLYFIIFVA